MTSPSAIAALIAVNLIPLAAAALLGWNAVTLLMLYWAENAAIGLYNIGKMVKATQRGELGKSKSYQVIFYVTHYSTFWVMHGVFLTSIYLSLGVRANGIGIIFFLTVALYVVSHAVAYREVFLKQEEYTKVTTLEWNIVPYARVVGTHVALSVLAAIAWQFDEPQWFIVAIAGAKIPLDLASHVFIHSAIARRNPAQPIGGLA